MKGALAATAVQKAWSDKRGPVLACGSKLGKAAAVLLGFAIRANGTVKNVTFKQSAVGATVED